MKSENSQETERSIGDWFKNLVEKNYSIKIGREEVLKGHLDMDFLSRGDVVDPVANFLWILSRDNEIEVEKRKHAFCELAEAAQEYGCDNVVRKINRSIGKHKMGKESDIKKIERVQRHLRKFFSKRK